MNVMLDVVGLDIRYGSSQVLFGLKLKVHHGETLALLGRNGAGKSTSMKAIAGVIASTAGSIRFSDKDITGMPSHLIARAGIGFVPEDRQIFTGLSVQDNLTIAAKLGQQGEQVWTLERVYEMLPLLYPLRQRMGGLLSGGEQQMLTIGRALMGNPSLLLLDEPTASLDAVNREVVLTLIEAAKARGAAIIGIFHDEQARARLCDRLVDVTQFTPKAVQ